jgi:preprotein translocase subunit SecF
VSDLQRTYAADPSQPGPGGRRHRFGDFYHERTNFQFIDRSWRWAVLSGTAVLVSLLFLVFGGLNLGIEFDGGTQWSFTRAEGSSDAADVRDVLAEVGQADAKVLVLGRSGVRVQTAELPAREQTAITEALAEYAGIEPSEISITNVGPTWGDRLSRRALQALAVFFVAIAIYLSLRFEWRMALAAIIAVIHDIIVTAGVYAITGFEVTPATVVAFLTILGFSLYDTVVVFDKVKENEATLGSVRGDTYSMMVNRSLNQVLIRSLNTSFVAVLPVVSLLVVGRFGLGAVGLQDFALALLVGLLTGAYSSIFLAIPMVAAMKEREPRSRTLRERAIVARTRGELAVPVVDAPTPAVAAVPVVSAVATLEPGVEEAGVEEAGVEEAGVEEAGVEEADVEEPEASPTEVSRPKPAAPGAVTPRPRQQRRKRR